MRTYWMLFVASGKSSSSSGVGARELTHKLCASARLLLQRPRLLNTKLRKAPWSTACALGSPTTIKSLRLYLRNARRTRTSGNSRRWAAKSASPFYGTSSRGTGWTEPIHASCGWTTRRSEVCRYRQTWLLWSQSCLILAPRTKAPCQLARPPWWAESSLGARLSARSADADQRI